ncbi:hypothetical protein BDV93DRAFT_560284 [Ceratobasidium sp. AG-I]|nr:hypothetical protein BDV93DRAFT_560284 [Ceratobasidium sp. AG-I]
MMSRSQNETEQTYLSSIEPSVQECLILARRLDSQERPDPARVHRRFHSVMNPLLDMTSEAGDVGSILISMSQGEEGQTVRGILQHGCLRGWAESESGQTALASLSAWFLLPNPPTTAGLPPIPPNVKPTQLFGDTDFAIIKTLSVSKPRIEELVSAVLRHEALYSPQDALGIFARMAADEAFGNPQIPPIEPDSISAYMLEPPPASLFNARSPDHLARGPLGYVNWLSSEPFNAQSTTLCYGGQRGVVWAVLPLLRFLDDSTTSLQEVFQERRVRGQPPSVVDVDCEAEQHRDEPISPTGSRTPRSSSPGSQHPTLDVHMPQPDAEDTMGQTSVITEHLEDRVNEYVVKTRDARDEHGTKPTTESITGQRGRAKNLRTSKSMTSMTDVMSAQALAPTPTGHSMPWGNNPNYPGWAFPPRLEPMTGPSMTHAELMEQEDVRQHWMRTYQAQMSGVSNPGPTPQASIPRQPPSLASKANLPDASAEATAAPPPTAAKTKGTPGATVPSRKRKASPPGALDVPGMSDELEPEHEVPREQAVSNSFMNPPSEDSLFHALDEMTQVSTPHASSKRAVRSSSRVSQKTIGSKSGSEVPERGKSSSTSRSQSVVSSAAGSTNDTGAELENVRDTGKKPRTTAAQQKQPVKAPVKK